MTTCTDWLGVQPPCSPPVNLYVGVGYVWKDKQDKTLNGKGKNLLLLKIDIQKWEYFRKVIYIYYFH